MPRRQHACWWRQLPPRAAGNSPRVQRGIRRADGGPRDASRQQVGWGQVERDSDARGGHPALLGHSLQAPNYQLAYAQAIRQPGPPADLVVAGELVVNTALACCCCVAVSPILGQGQLQARSREPSKTRRLVVAKCSGAIAKGVSLRKATDRLGKSKTCFCETARNATKLGAPS
jgi:hypothetical protein